MKRACSIVAGYTITWKMKKKKKKQLQKHKHKRQVHTGILNEICTFISHPVPVKSKNILNFAYSSA